LIPVSFLLSGACGLIYEVAWARLLGYVFGTTVFAVSAVLAAYMAGLAGGSWLFGRISEKHPEPLKLFGLLQAGIGIAAFAVPFLFAGAEKICVLFYRQFNPSFSVLIGVKFLLSFAVLFLPCALMGGTLPVLNKHLMKPGDNPGRSAGWLYAVNTAGAVLGCVFAGFFAIGAAGIRETIYLACALNLAAAAMAIAAKRPENGAAGKKEPEEKEVEKNIDGRMLWLTAVSGFTALAYELLWTRGLIFFITNTTYAFTVILSTILAGIAAGSWFSSKYLSEREPVKLFGITQALIGLFALVSVLVLGRIDFLVDRAWLILGKSWWGFVAGSFASALLVMGIPAFLFGVTFPLAVNAYGGKSGRQGRATAAVYSANTLGSIFGSVIAGFVLVPALGILKSIIAVALLNVLAGAAALLRRQKKTAGVLLFLLIAFGAVSGGLLVTGKKPVITASWGYKNLRDSEALLYYREGITSSVAVVRGPRNIKMLSVDGQYTAYAAIEDLQIHVLLGYLPYFLAANPKTALVIGFGMGVTADCLCQPGIEQVDCVEIASEESGCAEYFGEFNNHITANPAFELIIDDGRNYALATRKKYDIISSNAVHVRQSPSLYTKEFYSLCRERLNDGGVMCQWLPTNWLTEDEFRGLVASFREVFPACLLWYVSPAHLILTGTKKRQELDFRGLIEKAAQEKAGKDLSRIMLEDPYKLLSLLMMDSEGLGRYAAGAKKHTDNLPCAEFGKIVSPAFSFVIPDDIFRVNPEKILSCLRESDRKTTSMKETVSRYCNAARHSLAADIFYWSGNPRSALEEYGLALKINPGDRYSQYWLGAIKEGVLR